MALRFLFHVGRAVANQGIGGIARALADPSLLSAGDLIGKIAFDAWGGLRGEKKQNRLDAEILEAVKMDFAEIKRQAVEIAAQVAPDDPEMRGHVERFVTLVPASIVASLRRAEDPTGTTLPHNYAVEDESDIAKLLPVRFPRAHFQVGYAPPFLRGWELVEQLGAGGFGEVWKVRNVRTTNLVRAVKFGHTLNDAELSLLNEGEVLNRLLAHGHHPGIVELHGVWADGDEVPWLMYEYMPGGDLTGLIGHWSAMPTDLRLPKVLTAFRQLCETVDHFHRLKPSPIVHRDLKPSNILVTADGKLKIGDFGIGSVSAKRILDGERRGTLSRTTTVQAYLRGAHTPLYAPPEQKNDPKHRPQPTDDVHALGVILFQMLTGRLDTAPGPKFERDLKGVSAEVVKLIGDCADPEKAERPRDAGNILARLVAPSKPQVRTSPPDRAKERGTMPIPALRTSVRLPKSKLPESQFVTCPLCNSSIQYGLPVCSGNGCGAVLKYGFGARNRFASIFGTLVLFGLLLFPVGFLANDFNFPAPAFVGQAPASKAWFYIITSALLLGFPFCAWGIRKYANDVSFSRGGQTFNVRMPQAEHR